MKKIEKVLQEFSRDISDHYTIVVQDEKGRKRFTFKDHRVRALEGELKKHYGDKVVKKICANIRRAETRGTLKNFAVDDSVDFIIDGESVKALFKEDTENDINEVQIEAGPDRWIIVGADGKERGPNDLNPEEDRAFQQIRAKIRKAGLMDRFRKVSAKPFDITIMAGGKEVHVISDDGKIKKTFNL